jgi:cytochrome c-type biogenesis protein CcmE
VLETLGARRLLLIAALAVAVLVGGVAASNLASSTVYYLTPSEARARNVAVGQTVRLGGQVKAGSLECCFMYAGDGLRFVMTDGVSEVTVIGAGAVPGLLREGAGAVVEGTFMTDGLFHATQVIAKHDEVYTAPKAGATPAHRTGFP